MKKILTTITLFLLTVTLVACSDKKSVDDSVSVIFYTTTSGTQIAPYRNLEPNQLIEEPKEPTRTGFRFDGWFKDINYNEEWDFSIDKIGTKTIALYAKWGPGYFSIDYVLNGGTMPLDFKPLEDYPEDQRNPETNPELLKYLFYTVGRNNVLPRPTRTGYVFKNFYLYPEYGWEGAPAGTDQSWKPGDSGHNIVPSSLARDLILYAHWDPVKMSIAFNTNYPVADIMTSGYYRSRTLTYGFEFIYDSNYNGELGVNRLPDFRDFNNKGISYEDLDYEFIGWNTRADGTGNWYGDGTGTPGESTTLDVEFIARLFAQWRLKNA